MSKKFLPFPWALAAFALIIQIFTNADAQDVDVRIKINADKVASADIRVTFASNIQRKNPRDLWFLDEYAGITGITERISIGYIYDRQGYLISRKRFTAGERVSGVNIGGLGYTVDLAPLAKPSAAAHVSWVKSDGGMLMLDDLLPQSVGKMARIWIEVPVGWKILTTEPEIEPNVFLVSDIEKAVFYLGSNIREQPSKTGHSGPKLSISGEWLFADSEAAAMVQSIFAEYEILFGKLPNTDLRIWISKFPIAAGIGNWEAAARGRSLTIISSDMPFKAQSLQRLHEQLRHELFHLWVPNAVNLTGNYDWFYEGFALYQSLKLGVAVGRIRFDDFLDTLSRAYNIDISQAQRRSLIDASKNRWTGANTQVYARGMLIAFLCDLALLQKSNGKRSATDIPRSIYQKHRQPNPAHDGNAAVLSIMRGYSELVPIIDRYITGAENIEWIELLKAAGLEGETRDRGVELKLIAKPSGRQKDLLDKLGYNSWRKLSNGNR